MTGLGSTFDLMVFLWVLCVLPLAIILGTAAWEALSWYSHDRDRQIHDYSVRLKDYIIGERIRREG